jgi:hypothetical protein
VLQKGTPSIPGLPRGNESCPVRVR